MLLALIKDLYWSSPRTTFAVNPLTVVLGEALIRRRLAPDVRFLPLLAWGYLQYRLCGIYRSEAGGRGMQTMPDRLVTSGPYALCRNPMYLGHLIFSLGLVLVFRSPVALALAALRAVYFGRRVARDEERLLQRFGDDYRAYQARVKRWLPGLF